MDIRGAIANLLTGGTAGMLRAAEAQGIDLTVPPPRIPASTRQVSDRESLSQPGLFRAVQVITTAAGQVSLDAERGGVKVAGRVHPYVRRPALNMTRPQWIEAAVMSLLYTGNLYVMEHAGAELRILNPHMVRIEQDDNGTRWFHYDGTRYNDRQVRHATFLPPLPGSLYGLGPIQAAQSDLRTQRDLADLMTRHHHDTGQPRGLLKSDQKLTAAEARVARNVWNGLDHEGEPLPASANPSGVKVLGAGLDYAPILLSPKDALWLEAQTWTTRDLAMLLGVPASLMLVSLDGGSQTYSNIEQDWLGFIRFTMAGYLRPIEGLLSDFLPAGQDARFNFEALLRPDTTTRYANHAAALSAGWMTVDEIRAIEGLPPLTTAPAVEATPTTEDNAHA